MKHLIYYHMNCLYTFLYFKILDRLVVIDCFLQLLVINSMFNEVSYGNDDAFNNNVQSI